MKKKSNSKKSKLEINSLEYLLFNDLIKHESSQIRGGCSSDIVLPPIDPPPVRDIGEDSV